MTLLIIAGILVLGLTIFIANAIPAIIIVKQGKNHLFSSSILVISGIITFLSIIWIAISAIEYYFHMQKHKKDNIEVKYEIIQEPIYRKIN